MGDLDPGPLRVSGTSKIGEGSPASGPFPPESPIYLNLGALEILYC